MQYRDLQDTQELSANEIQDAQEQDDALNVPDFTSHTGEQAEHIHVPQKNVTVHTYRETPEPDTEVHRVHRRPAQRKPDPHKRTILIASIVIAVLIVLFLLLLAFGGKKEKEPAATASPSASASAETTASPSASVEAEEETTQSLSGFYLDAANSAVIAQLNEEFGTNGYVKPSISDYKTTGNMEAPTVSFTVTAAKDGTNYDFPAVFRLRLDSQQNAYTISDYTIDEKNAKESGLQTELSGSSTSSSKKKKDSKKKKSGKVDTKDMEQAGSYPVNASTGISADVTISNEGTVKVVAVSESGKKTEIGTVEGPGTRTVEADVDAGKYDIVFYTSSGTSASWTFTAK